MYPVPFRAGHFAKLRLGASQARNAESVTEDNLTTLEGPHSVTLMHDGSPVVIIGVVPVWENRAKLWCFLREEIADDLLTECKELARGMIDALPCRRLEAAIDTDFDLARRWLEGLGFTSEGILRAYHPDGTDATLYALVRA